VLNSLLLQDAAPTGEAEEAAEDDAEAAQGLDLSLTKKKKKKKTKARTDDEFGAMVEDVEGTPAEGESSLLENWWCHSKPCLPLHCHPPFVSSPHLHARNLPMARILHTRTV
jgi:hypothetical protein